MTAAPHLPGFEDEELLPGEDLASEPAFWLAHLLLTLGHDVEEPEEYGVARAAYDALVERLSATETPTLLLRVPFRRPRQIPLALGITEEQARTLAEALRGH
ncbi:hypothetical protein ACFV1W_09505 [Kitasatospora sp. NPDC059648]|uniref:hypothetical protein n=1 Tax=Kitasatospora sp. NPDC059648 TaxID=3346894 RepID=UPI003696A14F